MINFQHFILEKDEYIIYLNGNYIFTNEHKNYLIEQFQSLDVDILSPLIKNNKKKKQLVYFGGYYLEDGNIYYLDERIVNLNDLESDSNLYFTRPTQLHFQDLFICKKIFYNKHIKNFSIELSCLSKFSIYISPFIQICTSDSHFHHDIINPYSFENKYWKMSLLKYHQEMSSYKIEEYRSIIWNKKKNILFLVQLENIEFIKDKLSTLLNLNHNLYLFGNNYYSKTKLNINEVKKKFTKKNYLLLNKDLRFSNYKEAFVHLWTIGLSEGRNYMLPNNFNWKDYLNMNPDLSHISNQSKSKNHYLKYGSFEFREYSDCLDSFKTLNDIDYLRFRGVNINTHNIKLERFLKNNHNLFDYIFIVGKSYLKKLKIIHKICHVSKIVDFSDNLKIQSMNIQLSGLPLIINPRAGNSNGKICLLYQCYYQINNCQKVLEYFQSLNNNYIYHLILINNNDKINYQNLKNEETIDLITYLDGDNTYREMSGYQLGIEYLKKKKLVNVYKAFILLNETLFTNYPLHILDTLDYNHLNKVIHKPLVMGKVDKNNRTHNPIFNCDGWGLEKWIRSNFILINKKIFIELIKYKLVNYSIDNSFKDGELIIPMDKQLKVKILKWLSKPRYQHYSEEQQRYKIVSILNEYKLSHNILLLSNLTPI